MISDSESIEIKYECNGHERQEGSSLLARVPVGNQPRASLGRSLFGWGLFLALLTAALFAMRMGHPHEPLIGEMPPKIMLAIGLFAIGALFWVVAFIMLRMARLRALSRWNGETTYTFDQHGMTMRRPRRSDFFAWPRFRAYYEGPNVFVLRMDAKNGIVIPKRLFVDNGAIERMRQMMQDGVTVPAIPQALGFPISGT
jgi:hypothetical protein